MKYLVKAVDFDSDYPIKEEVDGKLTVDDARKLYIF